MQPVVCRGTPSRRSLTLTTYSPGTAIAVLCFGSLLAVTKINANSLSYLPTYLCQPKPNCSGMVLPTES